jgi:hypothetical protein
MVALQGLVDENVYLSTSETLLSIGMASSNGIWFGANAFALNIVVVWRRRWRLVAIFRCC